MDALNSNSLGSLARSIHCSLSRQPMGDSQSLSMSHSETTMMVGGAKGCKSNSEATIPRAEHHADLQAVPSWEFYDAT